MSRDEKHQTVDEFQLEAVSEDLDPFKILIGKPRSSDRAVEHGTAVATARFHGFGPDDRPLIANLPELPGEIVSAQTIVPLRREQVGSQVVVSFERGDVRRPIVMGVLQEVPSPAAEKPADVEVQADAARYVISAEREIVLRCGDASITLTRAGKVIIKGKYVLSRSSGYNKIKGAAVDIN
jgi:Domain of unknown function (DUF6484)